MATTTFDSLARELGGSMTRRSALRGLFAGAVAVVAGGAVLTHDAEGKRRRKKKNRKQQGRFLQPGEFCSNNSQCDGSKGYICAVAVNAGNSDKTCSGGAGAVCGAPNGDGDDTAPFCAVGFRCVNQICQPLPPE